MKIGLMGSNKSLKGRPGYQTVYPAGKTAAVKGVKGKLANAGDKGGAYTKKGGLQSEWNKGPAKGL